LIRVIDYVSRYLRRSTIGKPAKEDEINVGTFTKPTVRPSLEVCRIKNGRVFIHAEGMLLYIALSWDWHQSRRECPVMPDQVDGL